MQAAIACKALECLQGKQIWDTSCMHVLPTRKDPPAYQAKPEIAVAWVVCSASSVQGALQL